MRPGTVIASRFEILSRVRRGGEGQVFRGRDLTTGLEVAIKLLHEDVFKSPRFEREVELLSQLGHPGVVRYVAHGTLDGRYYLVMEWVKGQPLTRMLRYGLTMRQSVDVVHRIAETLAAVHLRGVVHRDIKPANIMFENGRFDRVRLLDFGIARRVGQPGLTRTGAIVGTPGYMSPEQARGDWDVDARTDVFALGCVLYHCLCGRAPFSSRHLLATLSAILFLEPVAIEVLCPEAPAPLGALIRRMLAKDRLARPADASVVAAELSALSPLPLDSQRRPSQSELEDGETENLETPTTQTYTEAADHEHAPLFILVALSPRLREVSAGAGDSDQDSPARADFVVRAHREVERHRGLSSLLNDGTFVAIVSGDDHLTEQYERAARCALGLRELIPDAPVVLGAGDAVASGSSLDRLVQALVEETFRDLTRDPNADVGRKPIRLGDGVAQVLGDEFELERGDAISYLIPRDK